MSGPGGGGGTLESDFLFYERRAGTPLIKLAALFALLLLWACVAIYPYRTIQLERIGQFIPVIDTIHLLFSGIIATVLLSLASVVRSRGLIALGTGYFFIALMAVAHGLTFPGTFSPTGLFGANADTVTWLYLAWHTALPLAVIAYSLLKEKPQRFDQDPVRGRAIFFWLALAAAAAAAMTWLATAGDILVSDDMNPVHARHWYFGEILLIGVAMAMLWRGSRSILDIGLMLTLWAWLLEFMLIPPPAARFSVGWYAGRVMGLLSGLFVLLMLLIEMSRLYARTVMLIAAQRRERDNRLMVGEAVGAFIAHELRQPLAALNLNAYTAQKLGAQSLDAAAGTELSGVLDDLMQDSRRANDIIESTRALVRDVAGQKRPTDINQLVRDTLLMTSHELRNHNVKVEVQLDEHLPPVAVNRMQMQQVFMNLFINAAEAMSGVNDRSRQLTIRSSSGEVGLIIRVEDTGPSIEESDRERIFEPFFTTKSQGTGMGLSICRSVMLAHGGSIRVAPRTPFGASFEILLPDAGLSGPIAAS